MYKQSLNALRAQLFSFEEEPVAPKKQSGLIQARAEATPLKEAPVGSYADWLKTIRQSVDNIKATSTGGGFGAGLAKGLTDSLFNSPPKEEEPPTVDMANDGLPGNRDALIRRRSSGPSYYAPRSSDPDTFMGLIDTHEGGGDYNTLFQFSNQEGKPFAGVKVSEMTLGEVKEFSSKRGAGSYYQWSKENMPKGLIAYKKGLGSTPMGRYQFIGSTLAEVTKEMGLSDDTVFSPEVQDAMFEHYLKKTIARGDTLDEKVAHVRSAWEGFNNVDRKTLENLIIKYEG